MVFNERCQAQGAATRRAGDSLSLKDGQDRGTGVGDSCQLLSRAGQMVRSAF